MMNKESKGRAWYDTIYRKFETLLRDVEVDDTLASQGEVSLEPPSSDDPIGLSSGWDDLGEEHYPDTFDIDHAVDLPIPSDVLSDHESDASESVCSEVSEHESDTLESVCSEVLEHESVCSEVSAHESDTSESVGLEERVDEISLEEKLSESKPVDEKTLLPKDSECTRTISNTSVCREEPSTSSEEIFQCSVDSFLNATPYHDDTNVSPAAEIKSEPLQEEPIDIKCVINEDEIVIENSDTFPFATIELYDTKLREDLADFDDNLLHETRDRSMQLRSFTRKVMDAITSKRRREKEYEQLAVWFGDAKMGSDLKEHVTTTTTTSLDSSNIFSHSNAVASEDHEWETL